MIAYDDVFTEMVQAEIIQLVGARTGVNDVVHRQHGHECLQSANPTYHI